MSNEKFLVLTVSDKCSSGTSSDTSGPSLCEVIKATFGSKVKIYVELLPDDSDEIRKTLKYYSDVVKVNVILTTGGTGFSSRDVTPEATKKVIEREAPNIIIALAVESLKITPLAMLSRSCAGIRGQTLIINFPGSKKAALECFEIVKPAISHCISLLVDKKEEVQKVHNELHKSSDGCSHSSQGEVDISKVALRARESSYPMISVDEALSLVLEHIRGEKKVVISVDIDDCLGYVLAEDVKAKDPLPPFAASVKDGYACLSVDGAGARKVCGGVAAGDAPDYRLKPGECARINTGAAMPQGADCVVQVEDTKLLKSTEDGKEELEIEILSAPVSGQDIRPIGHDISEGDIVLKKGVVLDGANIGILATVGAIDIPVYRRPTIGILSTGNELQDPKDPVLKAGHIRDSNKKMLMALLRDNHISSMDMGVCTDDPDSVKKSLHDALKSVDILITTGSVSMGDKDMLKPILTSVFCAKIEFGRLNMKPGKPTTFARCLYDGKQKYIFALPGNPVSAYVTFFLFVLPAVNEWTGCESGWPLVVVKLQEQVKLDPRPEYARAYLKFPNSLDPPTAYLTGNQCSSRLLSVIGAPALVLLPGATKERPLLKSGATVTALLIGKLRCF